MKKNTLKMEVTLEKLNKKKKKKKKKIKKKKKKKEIPKPTEKIMQQINKMK